MPQSRKPLKSVTARGKGAGAASSAVARKGKAASRRSGDPLATLLRSHRALHPRGTIDVDAIRRAYDIAERAHRGQMRKSGEPYITHPLAVAEICADLGMDSTALVAALLHDTVEDTQYTLDRLRADFCDEVAHLVDGVTKIDKVRFGSAAEAETIRKLILAAGRDPRVLVIKLADRVHNMRTLGFKSGPSQQRIARATNDVLIPLAGRLGIHVVKRELEDLVFAILQPEEYTQIRERVERNEPAQQCYLAEVVAAARKELKAARIKAEVVPRRRHLRSIWNRLRKAPGRAMEHANDSRIVIVVEGPATECYAALGVIHGKWHPVPGRFKDYIGVPKFNMYQSLHTTVIGPESKPLEVMIRTEGMNRVAEYGIAALQRYGRERPGDAAVELDWLQRVLDWQGDAAEPGEFLDSLRSGLSSHEVLVFTPSGRAVSLPAAGTPVDFAYAVSTRLGDRCVGAKVNGRLVPLSSPLSDGDVVEVLTSPSEYVGPSEEWLEFAKSPQAQIQIRRWFSEDVSDESIQQGRQAIVAALAREGRVLAHDRPLAMLARALDLPDPQSVCAAVADQRLEADEVARRLVLIVDGPQEE